MPKFNFRFIALYVSFLSLCSYATPSFAQPITPAMTSSEILHSILKLQTTGTVLYIAAHPDDENTRLITWLVNEKKLRTAYLSLTRGDGGQNLIGSEQGIELGMIRTQELLAARRIDGGEQYFTRAYDFGFSKTPKETFEKWNHDSVLGDVVWVIRNLRPDIIITRFATDGSGGHGHHTASAILAEEAFDAAGDPTRFPDQLAYGVTVWKPKRLLWNVSTRFQNPNADMSPYIKVDVGGYNALLGKSYGEIAAESRSMHRSQGFGSARQRGEALEFFKPIKGDTAGITDIFQGCDFTWNRYSRGKTVADLLTKAIREYNINNPSASLPDLIQLSDYMMSADMSYHRERLTETILAASGTYIDISTKQSGVAVGDSLKFNLSAISRTPATITGLNLRDHNMPQLIMQSSWSLNDTLAKYFPDQPFKMNKWYSAELYGFPKSGNVNPDYLSGGIQNNLFQPAQYNKRHLPESGNSIICNTGVTINDRVNSYSISRTLRSRKVDPSFGEVYKPLRITPPVLISIPSDLLVFTSNTTEQHLRVTVKAQTNNVRGVLRIAMPEEWGCRYSDTAKKDNRMIIQMTTSNTIEPAFYLEKINDEWTIDITIINYKGKSSISVPVSVTIAGNSYNQTLTTIAYDHIPTQYLFRDARFNCVYTDLKHNLRKIGYIPGAGDNVSDCLKQIGYEVTILTNEMLASANLSVYDAIVTGVRTYNTNERMPEFKKKLMDYVSKGGNLIVQYNTNSFAGPLRADIGPFPFKISRDRITDETAEVKFLIPSHPIFNSPNKITAKDFEGWIQERSIYHVSDRDSNFVAPISMHDPGEKENDGALIIAKYGKGYFIYTGLVFFRELSAGVPGAYRLMVNLIETGK